VLLTFSWLWVEEEGAAGSALSTGARLSSATVTCITKVPRYVILDTTEIISKDTDILLTNIEASHIHNIKIAFLRQKFIKTIKSLV
jgi:hypothetical protein